MLEHLNATTKQPSRVVIIGAAGFVGAAIREHLERTNIRVLPLTRNQVDLLHEEASAKLSALLKPDDAVVFVSAIAPARNSAMLLQNLRMAETVCAALAMQSVTHLVYISSDAVYADRTNPVTERSVCEPSTMHGMMHATRELMIKNDVKIPIAILRPSLLYGVRDPHNGYGPNRFRRLAEKGEGITLFGKGEEQRDHVFIDDVAKIVALVLAQRSKGILNIATGRSISFRAIAEKVVALAGKRSEIRETMRQNPVTHRHFDITDCLKAFPLFNYTSIDDGLALAAQGSVGGLL